MAWLHGIACMHRESAQHVAVACFVGAMKDLFTRPDDVMRILLKAQASRFAAPNKAAILERVATELGLEFRASDGTRVPPRSSHETPYSMGSEPRSLERGPGSGASSFPIEAVYLLDAKKQIDDLMQTKYSFSIKGFGSVFGKNVYGCGYGERSVSDASPAGVPA